MNTIFYLMLGVTLFSAMAILILATLSRIAQTAAERVLSMSKGQSLVKQKVKLSFKLQNRISAWIRFLRSRTGMSDDPRLLIRFAQSGFNTAPWRDLYAASRIAAPLAGFILGALIPYNRVFAMICLTSIGYLAPDIILQRTIHRRRECIRLGVPDAVDLLVICVDAGLGMDQAMLRVAGELKTSHPEIHQEFLQISREQRAGKLRIEAWQAMAERCKLPEMDAFVNMLLQTERFGTPIARALSNFGDQIRQRRRQKAEELAAKTTVKIIFPLVLCIFPSLFIVLLGPACISIAKGLGGLGQ